MPADHGGYFANDEQFLLPVVRSIYDIGRAAGDDQLFPQTDSKRKASTRREQRVRVLDVWRKIAIGSGVLAVFGSLAASLVAYWIGRSTGLYQPVQPVVDAAIGLWDGLGFLTARLPGKTPPLWQATLVGYLLWPALIGAFIWVLAPRYRDWRSAWPVRAWHAGLGLGLVSSVLLAVMGIALVIGIPGLVGVGIFSSPLVDQPWFRDLFLNDGDGRGLMAWLSSWIDRPWAVPVWGVLVTGLGALLAASGVAVMLLTYRLLDSTRWGMRLTGAFTLAAAGGVITGTWALLTGQPVVAVTLLTLTGVFAVLLVGVVRRPAGTAIHLAFASLLVVGALACLLWALVADVGIRVTAVGWLVILVVALAIQRIGVWRWNSWDHQERMEARSRWRNGTRRRPLGRWFDISVFTLLSASVIAGAVSIMLLQFGAGWAWLGLAGISGIAVSVALGAAQDAINERALAPTTGGQS
jgi:hypothetical protein